MSKQVITLTICDPCQKETGEDVDAEAEVFMVDGKVKHMDICADCAGRPHNELTELAAELGADEPPTVPGVRPVPSPGSKSKQPKREATCPVCGAKCAGEQGDLYSRGVKSHVRQNHEQEWEHYTKHGRWSNDKTAAAG